MEGVSEPSKRPQPRRSFYCSEDTTKQSIRDRVINEAPVHAELNINFGIQEEVVCELSRYISERYKKEEASVMVSVTHLEHIVLGGSAKHAYVLTITALPEQLQPTLNKRNAFLIQDFLVRLIGVSSERGFVKFAPLQEQGFATGGNTVSGKITTANEFEHRQPASVKSCDRHGLFRNLRPSALLLNISSK